MIFSAGLQKTDKVLKALLDHNQVMLKYIIPWEVVNWNLIKFVSVSSKETEHFQAPFGVIIFGSIQIENDQVYNPSTKKSTSRLLAKLHVVRKLKCWLKMIMQTEHFWETSCTYCKTAMLIEKKLADFLSWMEKVLLLACYKKNEHFNLDVGINRCYGGMSAHFDANSVINLTLFSMGRGPLWLPL